MRGSFFGLHVATSAAHAARGQLHTIAHNIANTETPGFSRQVAVQQANIPLRMGHGRGMIGTGTVILTVNQIRNSFLDKKFWNQSAVLGQFSKKHEIMTLTQGILRDGVGSETIGLSAELDRIFASQIDGPGGTLQDLTVNPHEMTARRNFLNSFESLATHLQSTYSQLRQQMLDLNQEIRSTVGIINSMGRKIASLNRTIAIMELDGSNANDLRDQRNLLIDELSRYVNVSVVEAEMNPEFAAGRVTDPRASRRELSIYIDGHQFVRHFDINELDVQQRRHGDDFILFNPEEPPGMYDIIWRGGRAFDMHSHTLSGELAGLINLRDGNGGNFSRLEAGTAVFPYLGNPNQLRIDFEPGRRVDLGPTGFLAVRNAAGITRHVRFTDFEIQFDADRNPVGAIFTLVEDDVPADGTFFTGAAEITVGRGPSYNGIPHFIGRLNELARTVAAAFNEGMHLDGRPIPDIIGHMQGFDLNDDMGMMLFGYRTQEDWNWRWDPDELNHFNYFNITASNFAINPALLRDPRLLALQSIRFEGESEGEVALSWTKIDDARTLFREGRLGDFLAAITGELGITAMEAYNFTNSYSELLVTIDNQRRAVSGVSMNEEVSHMILQQLIFQAAARMITIIDNLYDTTINRMGAW